jgi:hypothetical protein
MLQSTIFFAAQKGGGFCSGLDQVFRKVSHHSVAP